MKWARTTERAEYVSGPYRVKRIVDVPAVWRANGPGVLGGCWPSKTAAQARCQQTAERRIDENADPVVDDFVRILADGRRGQVTAILRAGTDDTGAPAFVWCLNIGRGKRLCLLRHEIELVTP